MISFFKKSGYEPGMNLFGFPYDWRQTTACSLTMSRLERRVVEEFKAAGDNKIYVITHSLGGVVFMCFMQQYPDVVKRYIRGWMPIACPFRGATKFVEALTFGYNFGVFEMIAPPKDMQKMEVYL